MDFIVSFEDSDHWSFGYNLAFIYEARFFFLSIGMTIVSSLNKILFDEENESSFTWDEGDNYMGFFTELGLIIKLNNRKPEGLVLKVSVSANPLSASFNVDDSYSQSDLLGDLFRESVRFNVGLGYTF